MTIVVERGVSMRTRDGIDLVADVFRPDGGVRYPALLHRTPYGRATTAMIVDLIADPAELAAHGYVVVVQDVRGRFDSGGDWTPFVHERDDGYDTVEWVAAQPWCDGRVGVYGSSYMGITAYQALLADPPHLAAAATVVSGCDLNDGLARTGGAFELGFVSFWALSGAPDTITRDPDPERRAESAELLRTAAADPWGVVRALPWSAAAPAQVCNWLGDWIDGEPDAERWKSITVTADDVRVPLLQVVGFRDWMQPSMLRLFRDLPVDGRSRLVAGPWTHRSAYGGPTGTRDWTAAAPAGPAGHTPRLVAWFDRWLRDEPDDAPRASWFVSGEDVWRHGDTWPPPTTERGLFLDGEELTSGPGTVARSWRHDPADPVPSIGGMTAMPLFAPDGPQDRRKVEDRGDVCVFTGEVLAEPLRLAGRARVELDLTCDRIDADLVVHLVDVHPDGVAEGVTEGVQRLRYRQGGHDAFLVPGQPAAVTVSLADAAHTIAVGHRLRLEVAASNFPRFTRNPGTAELPERTTDLLAATLTIGAGSRLVLPLTG